MSPVNLPGARIRGIEAGLALRAFGRDLAADLSWTYLDTHQRHAEVEQNGKPLPAPPPPPAARPPRRGHRFVAGPTSLEPRAFYSVEFVDRTFLDPSGRYELPARVLHGIGVELSIADRVHLGFEVRNLSDLRSVVIRPRVGPPDPYPVAVGDFIGYPLPGRSLWSTLRIDVL